MDQIIRIGMDTSKHVFQLHGVECRRGAGPAQEAAAPGHDHLLRASSPPTCVAIEACGAIAPLGAPAAVVRPRGEADRAAAGQALCQARQERRRRRRGAVRGDEPADHALRAGQDGRAAGGAHAGGRARSVDPQPHPAGQRDPRLRGRVSASWAPRDIAHRARSSSASRPTRPCRRWRESCSRCRPRSMRDCRPSWRRSKIKLLAWHRADEGSRRLARIPGVGPIGAAMLMMKTPAPEAFRSGRQFAAWIGLTPKDHSTAGKVQAWRDHARR